MLSISEGSFLGSLLETAEFAEVSRMFWLHGIPSSMHHCARTRVFVRAGNDCMIVLEHACMLVYGGVFSGVDTCLPASQRKPVTLANCL